MIFFDATTGNFDEKLGNFDGDAEANCSSEIQIAISNDNSEFYFLFKHL